MGLSFIDDEEKMIDLFFSSKRDFLNFYSYLSEEEYDATINDIVDKSGYWYKEWYDDNPDKDGRTLRDIVTGLMITEWLNRKEN